MHSVEVYFEICDRSEIICTTTCTPGNSQIYSLAIIILFNKRKNLLESSILKNNLLRYASL